MLDRIHQFIREADAVGLRHLSMTISPSTSRRLPASEALLVPKVVVMEDNGTGHCLETVERPARDTDSSGSGPKYPPSEAETAFAVPRSGG